MRYTYPTLRYLFSAGRSIRFFLLSKVLDTQLLIITMVFEVFAQARSIVSSEVKILQFEINYFIIPESSRWTIQRIATDAIYSSCQMINHRALGHLHIFFVISIHLVEWQNGHSPVARVQVKGSQTLTSTLIIVNRISNTENIPTPFLILRFFLNLFFPVYLNMKGIVNNGSMCGQPATLLYYKLL